MRRVLIPALLCAIALPLSACNSSGGSARGATVAADQALADEQAAQALRDRQRAEAEQLNASLNEQMAAARKSEAAAAARVKAHEAAAKAAAAKAAKAAAESAAREAAAEASYGTDYGLQDGTSTPDTTPTTRQSNPCDGEFLATTTVVISGSRVRFVGKAVNTTGFVINISAQAPAADAFDPDNHRLVTAWTGYQPYDNKYGDLAPGKSWEYASGWETMNNPNARWDDLNWNPIVQFSDYKKQDFCGQRSVPAYHDIQQ